MKNYAKQKVHFHNRLNDMLVGKKSRFTLNQKELVVISTSSFWFYMWVRNKD